MNLLWTPHNLAYLGALRAQIPTPTTSHATPLPCRQPSLNATDPRASRSFLFSLDSLKRILCLLRAGVD